MRHRGSYNKSFNTGLASWPPIHFSTSVAGQPVKQIVLIGARPGKLHSRHAAEPRIKVALHQAELKFARQAAMDGDVRRGFHVEVVGIPDLHAGDAPSAQHSLLRLFHSSPAKPATDQRWSKSSPTPQPTFCPS